MSSIRASSPAGYSDTVPPPSLHDVTLDGAYSDDAAGDMDLPYLSRFEIFMPAVQSLVNALGGYEEVETSPGKLETVYRPGDSVLAVLKDLKKLWRKDDEDDERTVARCMAKAGLMKELIALVVEMTERGDWGRKVALVACDLIAALTWPIDVAQELKEMEDEPNIVTDYASLLRAQREYKAMILQTSAPLRCILALILPSLAKPRRDEKDERIISLGLHIIRNLLAIKDAVAEGTATGEKEELARLQSTLIMQLDKLTYFQLLLTLASCADKSEFNLYNVLVLDILHLVFRSVKVTDLGQDPARAPIENLSKLLDAEKRRKSLNSRVGMTRHSRFGTTVAVRAGDQKIVLHKQNAISANPGKILDEVKRKRAGRAKRVDELTFVVDLSPDAMRVLQNLAKTFIQSCFNTFFASILKDIRMERSKVRPSDNTRTFFLARFFIEYLLLLRAKEDAKKGKGPAEGSGELALGLVAEMAEMDSVRWVVMRMRSTMDDRPPAWTELQACLDCFTQILLLIDAMSTSPEEEDVEVAEILQNQLYYNGDILDSALQVVVQYKDQSVGYLNSIIHFAYVLLRMLERYSKTKAFMFVRKRRAARKKRKDVASQAGDDGAIGEPGPTMPEEYGGEEDDEGEGLAKEEGPSYAEHKFTFESFEKRFAQEAVVNTLMAYLTRFEEFEEPEQMKRVVGLMHRQVIKTQAEGLYFKVSCLNLFRRILDAQPNLPKHDSTRDLVHLITFVLRNFFKRVQDDPFVIVQALGAKGRGGWKALSSYKSDEDEEDGDGMAGQRGRIKEKLARAELEFIKNKKLPWSEQMRVVVAVLFQQGKDPLIKWIIEVLELALAERQEVVLATDGEEALRPVQEGGDGDDGDDDMRVRKFGGPSKEAIEKFSRHELRAETDERKAALESSPHFRLMLQLLSFERSAAAVEAPLSDGWHIPAGIVPSSLQSSLGALSSFLASPPTLDADPKTLIRRKRPPRQRSPSYDSEGNEVVRPKPMRKKKQALEVQNFKSAAFIMDSDVEDEDEDRRFFERERELRREMEELARREGAGETLLAEVVKGRRRKGKRGDKGGKGKEREKGEDSMMDVDEGEHEHGGRGRSQSSPEDGHDDDSGEERDGSGGESGSEADSEAPKRRQRKRKSSPVVADQSDSEGERPTKRRGSSRPVSESGSEEAGTQLQNQRKSGVVRRRVVESDEGD